MILQSGAPITAEKAAKLASVFAGFDSALVAFSGGVDSTLLLLLAKQALGENILAVTVRSAGIPSEEAEAAADYARQLGVRHQVIDADVLSVTDYAQNTPQRCYACKLHVFGQLKKMAIAEGLAVVLDGTNADDMGDYRPGLAAARELGVRSPLLEAGISKPEVRALLQHSGYPHWDKPATPCLATRFPYGSSVTEAGLRQVRLAEKFLHEHGFRQVRVRHHGNMARIEVPPAEMVAVLEIASQIEQYIRETVGFQYVTLDLRGFRSGSMNEVLAKTAN